MPDDANLPAPQGQFLIYADGASQLQVRPGGQHCLAHAEAYRRALRRVSPDRK